MHNQTLTRRRPTDTAGYHRGQGQPQSARSSGSRGSQYGGGYGQGDGSQYSKQLGSQYARAGYAGGAAARYR